MTNRGERYMNPNFGGNLRATIFEQISQNNIENLKQILSADLKKYFPNITINSLDIYGTEDLNQLQVILNYSVINFGITETLQINL
jgi:phage baseplate assembly protein W